MRTGSYKPANNAQMKLTGGIEFTTSGAMLSKKDKEEFAQKVKKLEQDQESFRNTFQKQNDKKDRAGQFRPLAIIYEFISMVLIFSLGGYFLAQYTNTQPWTMIGLILFGFAYSFYRLYKSVT